MTQESDLRMGQSKFFPNQTRQPITLRATGGIAMAARGEQQTTLPRRNAKLTDRSPNHVRECANDQRMSGIHIIVIDRCVRMPARFGQLGAERLAIQQAEIQCGGDHKRLAPGLYYKLFDRLEGNARIESQNAGAPLTYVFYLS